MADTEDFFPHLGRQRGYGARQSPRYLGRVLAAANLARGSGAARAGCSGYSGHRTGRGAGIGRLLASRASGTSASRRRVIVKTSIVKLAGKGAAGAAAHLRYLQRDGTTRDGERGTLYGPERSANADLDAPGSEPLSAKAFTERGSGDRHQFRFIVSPEDGEQYDDLKPLTRRLMARIEEDLGTRLDWVAVDHHNTGHPHTHIVVRGKDDTGADLVLARDYLTAAIRERAADIVELDLGPRTQREIAATLRAEVEHERLTMLDRNLLARADADRIVAASAHNLIDHSLEGGRLAKLERLGLAERVEHGRYRLAPEMPETLTRMGERGDIIRTMQREFARARLERALADQSIYDPAAADARPLVGRVVAGGLADEHRDTRYLIVDACDGRSHYVSAGRGDAVPTDLAPGAIVRIEPVHAAVREVDRTIAVVAAANGGHYDLDAHMRHDPRATLTFAETHVRRLEAMRRSSGAVEREPSGRWIIAPDHLERVYAWETARLADRPVTITTLSAQPLERLVAADAATWLDRELVSPSPALLRDAGFGHAVRDAQTRRRQWLIAQGLADDMGVGTRFRDDLLSVLRRRELLRVAGQLSTELHLPFHEAASGEAVEGTYRRPVELVSGKFAVIERARDFTLVPWRPVLEHQVGKPVTGIMRGDGINWSIGRGRSGPGIS